MLMYGILLKAKKEIYDIKQQRLHLAQDEYNHLTNALATLNTSRTSCKYIYFYQCWKNYVFFFVYNEIKKQFHYLSLYSTKKHLVLLKKN